MSTARTASSLSQRALAEYLGTAFLVAAVVGSGIAAVQLSPGQPGLQLLTNSLITGGVLVALIVALSPVSAAFNPLVTLAELFFGAISAGSAGALILAQVAGGFTGAVLANAMFGLDAISISTHARSGSGLWLGEIVATLGLLVVIFGTVHSGRGAHVPYAVAGYIVGAYWFTSSTSFANPAVTIARVFSDTFSGIAPRSVPGFVAMQVVGAALAVAAISVLYPDARRLAHRVARHDEGLA